MECKPSLDLRLGFTPLVFLVLRPLDSDWNLHHKRPRISNLQMVYLGLFSFHNHMRQFLIRSLFLYIYILLVLSLWRSLTKTFPISYVWGPLPWLQFGVQMWLGAGRTGEWVGVKAGIRAGERHVDQELIMRNSGRSIDSLGVGWERGKSQRILQLAWLGVCVHTTPPQKHSILGCQNMDRPRSLLLAHVPADKGAPTSLTPSQEED